MVKVCARLVAEYRATDHGLTGSRLLAGSFFGMGRKMKTVLITGNVGTGKRELAAVIEKRLFDLSLQSYYLGISNVQTGLDSDIGGSFLDRDEQIRRLGELSRIMTDAGLIFISTFDGATDYDIERIRKLNSPNELFVVHLGDNEFEQGRTIAALFPGVRITCKDRRDY